MDIDFDKLPKEGFPARIEVDFGYEKSTVNGKLVEIHCEVIQYDSDGVYKYFKPGKHKVYIVVINP